MRSKKKIARKLGKNHVPLLYDVHSDPWTDGPNHWNSGDFRCLKVDIGTRFHFRSFLIDFDEKYWSNGSKIWAGGIHPSPAYTSTKKPGQIRVNVVLLKVVSLISYSWKNFFSEKFELFLKIHFENGNALFWQLWLKSSYKILKNPLKMLIRL